MTASPLGVRMASEASFISIVPGFCDRVVRTKKPGRISVVAVTILAALGSALIPLMNAINVPRKTHPPVAPVYYDPQHQQQGYGQQYAPQQYAPQQYPAEPYAAQQYAPQEIAAPVQQFAAQRIPRRRR